MKIITCALAILAAVSTAAVAKDLKQDKAAPTPTVKAQTMTDADMDKVTAGFTSDNNGANGGGTGFSGNDKGQGGGGLLVGNNNPHGRF
jgi:hypothetical protein